MTTSTARCIYCGRQDAFAREHYIPRALGTFRGCQPLADRLCRWCNESAGKLDEALVRTGPNALFREIAGVRGRPDHMAASPFYYDLLGGDTVKVLGKHPDYPFEVLWEVAPGMTTRELRQIVLRRGDEFLPLPLPVENILEYLRQAIREHGLEGAEVVAFFGGEQEGDAEYTAIFEAIEAVAEKGRIVSVKKGAAGHIVGVSSTLDITRTHLRAVTKIAFHYVLAHGKKVFTGHESAFDAAKRFILSDEAFEGRIALVAEPIVEQLRHGRLKHYGHFLQAEITHHEITVRAQFFVGPAVSPPTWVVQLARNPSYVYTDSFGHAFMLFETPASDGHQGEVAELTAIRRSLLPPAW